MHTYIHVCVSVCALCVCYVLCVLRVVCVMCCVCVLCVVCYVLCVLRVVCVTCCVCYVLCVMCVLRVVCVTCCMCYVLCIFLHMTSSQVTWRSNMRCRHRWILGTVPFRVYSFTIRRAVTVSTNNIIFLNPYTCTDIHIKILIRLNIKIIPCKNHQCMTNCCLWFWHFLFYCNFH